MTPRIAALLLPFALLSSAHAAVFPGPASKHSTAHRTYAGFDANRLPRRRAAPRPPPALRLHRLLAHQSSRRNHQPLGRQARHPPPHRLRLPRRRQRPPRQGDPRRPEVAGQSPAALARQDAAAAVAAARREGFPPRTILFLDQEEGGRMLPEQAAYLLAWTEAVAASGFRPGVYASGQPVPDGNGPDGKPATITTIQDIREHVAAAHLHPIAFWAYQDTCPPAPGCVVPTPNPPSPDLSGTLDLSAWQYAQSPRNSQHPACAATYNRDSNCYAPGIPTSPSTLASLPHPTPPMAADPTAAHSISSSSSSNPQHAMQNDPDPPAQPAATEVLIVGGGPAGLAAAIALRQRGIHCTVVEALPPAIDKACGEGLMPDSRESLAQLGITLTESDGQLFRGIRFANAGHQVHATFPSGAGIGVRRPHLHALLTERAREAGAHLLWNSRVQLPTTGASGPGNYRTAHINGQPIRFRWLIGADGQASTVRTWAGLDRSRSRKLRYGFRTHYRIDPALQLQQCRSPLGPWRAALPHARRSRLPLRRLRHAQRKL